MSQFGPQETGGETAQLAETAAKGVPDFQTTRTASRRGTAHRWHGPLGVERRMESRIVRKLTRPPAVEAVPSEMSARQVRRCIGRISWALLAAPIGGGYARRDG